MAQNTSAKPDDREEEMLQRLIMLHTIAEALQAQLKTAGEELTGLLTSSEYYGRYIGSSTGLVSGTLAKEFEPYLDDCDEFISKLVKEFAVRNKTAQPVIASASKE